MPENQPQILHLPDKPPGALRVATFNAALSRREAGEMLAALSGTADRQAREVAEIIQRVAPDVLLLCEFDYEPGCAAVDRFRENYLERGWNGAAPICYEHAFCAPVNTGRDSGFDLDRDGVAAGVGGDAVGWGFFPGQYGMALLSRFPVVSSRVRTFREFLWKDMPGANLPMDPEAGKPWYSDAELSVLRLCSKSLWDVPLDISGRTVHALAAHPTPPAFDGPEDANRRRNHDEIRLLADYADGTGEYIVDDAGVAGPLGPGERFVILGDLNADPLDGDSFLNPAAGLLARRAVNGDFTPKSPGGAQYGGEGRLGDPAAFTAVFRLRVDYVLPSAHGFSIAGGGVFWPPETDVWHRLVRTEPPAGSDHRLVYLDLVLED
ncbi:MAG: endonuclease/exonuclease/phosphatase family protein [Deltaproteobacteria bacterium]|nr:endonuclease/exonuclease/phosphatase family protein [Deltaproteobacteria bacterium]